MSEFGILLRRELVQKLSVFRHGKKPDILGWILSFVLTITIAGIFILIFGIFVDTYTKVQIGYVSDMVARKYEILTIMFAITLIINIVAGIIKINSRISSGRDLMLLMTLPIKNSTLFAVKFVMIFLELIVISWLILLPLSITFCIVTSHSIGIIFISALFGIFLPIIALSFCSVLALPLFYLKKVLSKFYYLTTLLFSALIVIAFIIYGVILNFLKLLLETGQIYFVFNESTINFMSNLAGTLFPNNLMANIMLGINPISNILWLALTILVSFVISFLVIRFVFRLVSQNKLIQIPFFVRNAKVSNPRSPIFALIKKEFIQTLRTPGLSFQYFAITLTLPLMVFVTFGITNTLLQKLIFIDCSFEIAILCMVMFSILTNTFCATNISRDGKFFGFTKMIPLTFNQIIFSKVLFCSIISIISIFITSLLLYLTNSIGYYDALLCFIIVSILSIGVICLATRKDLNNPEFEGSADKSNNTVSFIIFWGLIISAGVGVIALTTSLYLNTFLEPIVGKLIGASILFVFSLIIYVASYIYLTKGLSKKYKGTVV